MLGGWGGGGWKAAQTSIKKSSTDKTVTNFFLPRYPLQGGGTRGGEQARVAQTILKEATAEESLQHFHSHGGKVLHNSKEC